MMLSSSQLVVMMMMTITRGLEDQDDEERGGDDDGNPESPEVKQQLSLMREYLLCSLKPSMYISMPNPEHSPDVDHIHDAISFVQVIAVKQSVTTVATCRLKSEDTADSFLSVCLQPLEQMLPTGIVQDATAAEVFSFADDVPVDMDWGACVTSDRPKFLQWENAGSSLIENCTSLRNPQVLKPSIDLLHPRAPCLSLLDALQERGWLGKSQTCTHSEGSVLEFDRRKPMKNKRYFQCLLMSFDLYRAGVAEFKSGKPSTYYEFLLRKRKLPDPDKKNGRPEEGAECRGRS